VSVKHYAIVEGLDFVMASRMNDTTVVFVDEGSIELETLGNGAGPLTICKCHGDIDDEEFWGDIKDAMIKLAKLGERSLRVELVGIEDLVDLDVSTGETNHFGASSMVDKLGGA